MLPLGLLLCLVLAGCSGGGDTTSAARSESIRSLSDIRLPMDEYVASYEDRAVVNRARSALISQCMAERGFAGFPLEDWSALIGAPSSSRTQIGPVDLDRVREHGYRSVYGDYGLRAAAVDADLFGDFGDAAVIAALGDRPMGSTQSPDADGCRAVADREFFEAVGLEPDNFQFMWIDAAADGAVVRASEDAQLRPRIQAWSACMKQRGHAYATPEDARNSDAAGEDADPTEQRRLAVDDVTCAQESGYIDELVSLTIANQQEFIEANAERLTQAKADREAIRKHAFAMGHGVGDHASPDAESAPSQGSGDDVSR